MRVIRLERDLDKWNTLYYQGTRKRKVVPEQFELGGAHLNFRGPRLPLVGEVEERVRKKAKMFISRGRYKINNYVIGYVPWKGEFDAYSGHTYIPVSIYLVPPKDSQLELGLKDTRNIKEARIKVFNVQEDSYNGKERGKESYRSKRK